MALAIHLENSSSSTYPYLEIKNKHDGANSGEIRFLKQSSSADAGDDLGVIKFRGYSSGGSHLHDYAQIIGESKTTTSAEEEGQILFKVKSGGSELDSLTINPTGVGIGNTNPGSQLEISKVNGPATLELSSWSTTETEAHAGKLKFLKSGSATVNSISATSSGEVLGRIEAYGVDTAPGETLSSYIEFAGNAAADEDSVPGKIIFATSDADDAGTPKAIMTMNSSGLVFAGGSKVNIPYTGSNWGQIGRDVQNGGGGIEFRWASGYGDYICMTNFVNINHTSTSHTVRLNVNGDITATGTITGGSDDRIKYNEVNINGASALSIINQLQPQKYEKIMETPNDASGNWIPTDADWDSVKDNYVWDLEAGLIAQDIQAIPELSFAVNGEEVDSEGNQTSLSLNYNDIFTYHIAATKELSSQLDAEKAKVATLETQVADLLARVTALESA